jgi:hypothetical protein
VDEFADFMLGRDARLFKERGQKFTVLARRRISLPNGIVCEAGLPE